jgi:Family of unknown function (DUF5335)
MTVTTAEQRNEWAALADRISADYAGHDATIEVLDQQGGDNSLAARLPFAGITYDHKDDVVVISVGGNSPRYPVVLRHIIHHPKEILFDPVPRGAALKITDSTGTTTLVSLLRHTDEAGQDT